MASVDVVVPSYQYGRYLRDCVRSVLMQDVSDLRVLIIDNASTDDSVEVARRLAAEDDRVEVVARPRNLGPHASYNEGIDWAAADYFLILCADDYLLPGSLSRAIGVMEANRNIHLFYGKAPLVSGGEYAAGEPVQQPVQQPGYSWSLVPGNVYLEKLCRTARCEVLGPTVVVRTSVQKEVGYYRDSLPHTDDVEMWMRFACAGDLAETDAVQAVVRIHDTNRCSSLNTVHLWNLEMAAAFASFFAREGAALPDAARLHRMARRTLAERAYWCALSHLCRREPGISLDLLKFALKNCPDMAVVPPLSYLVRRSDSLDRIRKTVADMMAPLRRRRSGVGTEA